MNPIEELKREHRGIESALAVLDHMAGHLREDPDARLVSDAEALLDFFRTFVDTCHHGKEENGLFPALEQVGVSRVGGPIGVLLSEHEQGRSHIREMAAALKEHQAGRPAAADRFRRHAGQYRDLLQRHIEKEDRVLFPMASGHLLPPAPDRLEELFARIEEEVVGSGRHEQYHALLELLTRKYVCSNKGRLDL